MLIHVAFAVWNDLCVRIGRHGEEILPSRFFTLCFYPRTGTSLVVMIMRGVPVPRVIQLALLRSLHQPNSLIKSLPIQCWMETARRENIPWNPDPITTHHLGAEQFLETSYYPEIRDNIRRISELGMVRNINVNILKSVSYPLKYNPPFGFARNTKWS